MKFKVNVILLGISLSNLVHANIAAPSGPQRIECSARVIAEGTKENPDLNLVVSQIDNLNFVTPQYFKLGPATGMTVAGTTHTVQLSNDPKSGRKISMSVIVGNAADNFQLFGLGLVTSSNGKIEMVQKCVLPGVAD